MMSKPQLKTNIEDKLLSIIRSTEVVAAKSLTPISAKVYLQLADLYHFHKDYQNEIAILKRFSQLEQAANDSLIEIYERIERASQLKEFALQNEFPQVLELVPVNGEVVDKPRYKSAPQTRSNKRPFNQVKHTVLTVCAAYTGRSDADEIAQLALVLFEYRPEAEVKKELLETFVGERSTKLALPQTVATQFNINIGNKIVNSFDIDKIKKMFERADFVVSHNNAEVERKLLATLVSSAAEKPWYSSQKDIPWRALRIETSRLTQLARLLEEKIPRTCIERAITISQILEKSEPFSNQIYLERLYHMQPMKRLEWSDTLIKQRKRFERSSFNKLIKVISGVVGVLSMMTTSYFYFN